MSRGLMNLGQTRFCPWTNELVWWKTYYGQSVIFTVVPTSFAPGDWPCIYMFARYLHTNVWDVLYVGQTSDAADRFAAHEKWKEATREGMTHIHVHFLANTKSDRLQLETQLRHTFDPPLNKQPVPGGGNILHKIQP